MLVTVACIDSDVKIDIGSDGLVDVSNQSISFIVFRFGSENHLLVPKCVN